MHRQIIQSTHRCTRHLLLNTTQVWMTHQQQQPRFTSLKFLRHNFSTIQAQVDHSSKDDKNKDNKDHRTTAFLNKPIGHSRKDFIQIAQGAPGTKKQKLKYDAWYRQKTPELHHDETFLYLPSSQRVIYETVHLGRDEWLKRGKSNFSLSRFLSLPSLGSVSEDDSSQLKEQQCEINLEICSGFGQWFRDRVIAQAQAQAQATSNNTNDKGVVNRRHVRWIACEIKFRRCVSILGRLNYSIDPSVVNQVARVICAEASFGLEHLFPDASIDNVYIRFPEPWTKAQDASKRIINHSFGMLLSWKVKRHGTVTITTDDPTFRDWTIHSMWNLRELWNFEGMSEEQRTTDDNDNDTEDAEQMVDGEDRGGFEAMLRERGCTIYHLRYKRS